MKSTSLRTLLPFFLLLVLLPSPPSRGQAKGEQAGFSRLSSNLLGQPANGWSESPAISADGRYVAFASSASDLVQADTNHQEDIFLYDREIDQNLIVSISSDGKQGNGWSYQPALSANGRFVAFTSLAENLVPGDDNRLADIFVHDRVKGVTSLVSQAGNGKSADGWSDWPSISADGRFVAFSSLADNLVTGDTNGMSDVFVFDRLNQETERVSILPDNAWSFRPAMSADGRYVSFLSLPAGDGDMQPNRSAQLWIHDRLTGQTRQPLPNDFEATLAPAGPAISADGDRLLFAAFRNGTHSSSLYLYDRMSNQAIPVPGNQAVTVLQRFSISLDGNQAAFVDSSGTLSVFDRPSGQTQPIAREAPPASNGPAWDRPALSGQGNFIVFTSADFVEGVPPAHNLQSGPPAQVVLADRPASGPPVGFLSGWVSDGLGHPLAGVAIHMAYGHDATTGPDGSFRIEGLAAGLNYNLTPVKKGYTFSPANRLVSVPASFAPAVGLAFTATPDKILEEARKDIGMPYALTRGCPSPFKECGGPFHGFFAGDCTDLVIDAYRAALDFNIQYALERDFYEHPDHYYRWHDARSAQDMWRYFFYSGQILAHDQAYQPGDIAFFDWEQDGVTDHVAIISEVNSKGRPRKMIDASGKIDANPGGLASELDWQRFHDSSVQGHARWLGMAHPKGTMQKPASSWLLVALDSSKVTARLLDKDSQAIGATERSIPGGAYQALPGGAVVSLASPATGWYFIELTTSAGGPYQLGFQTLQAGAVTASDSFTSTLGARETRLFPLQLIKTGNRLVFTLPDQPH